jgi:rSAM/selenodomain-associated transferase 1
MQRGFVGVFVKEPRPGRVKTRLAGALSRAGAAELYEAFLRDTLALVAACAPDRVRLYHEGASPRTYVPEGMIPFSWQEIPQRGSGLGERLAAAAADAAAAGALPLFLLGSDSPDLPAAWLREGLTRQSEADLVLGPAADGGLWGIGIAKPTPGLFEGLPWSTPRAAQALRNRARSFGLKVADLPLWYDVDEPADLIGLSDRLQGESKAKWTSAWMASHTWRARIE